jgi:ATP-dependent Clp protease ATP-binding subunit ClpC
MNGYNFTERVRKILSMAREESARLHHEYVGTEHILLAFVREGEGVGMEVLRTLDGDPQAIARHIEKAVRPGRSPLDPRYDVPYTSRAKKVLELSMNEAAVLRHSYVGSEHLLLGLLAEGKGIAAQVLAEAGVTLDAARSEILRLLGTGEPPPETQPASHEEQGAPRDKPVDRVEVVLHYADGRRFEGSFASVRDAVGFLRSTARPSDG